MFGTFNETAGRTSEADLSDTSSIRRVPDINSAKHVNEKIEELRRKGKKLGSVKSYADALSDSSS